jgi:hypothetical protein
MRTRTGEESVSVIVGTLLLILITVTAAAGLALMVSQMEKQEMNRQSQINAVKDEMLQISGLSLENDPTFWNQSPYNVSSSQNWSSVSFNLMNLNTQAASVLGIAINNQYTTTLNFTSLPDSFPTGYCNFMGGNELCIYNNTGNLFDPDVNTTSFAIPAGQSEKVTINLASDNPPIGTSSQIDIKVITSLTNIFEKTFLPPTPLIIYNTGTTNIGTIQRDSIILDGSQSSSENATIVSWNWTIMNATETNPAGNCSDLNDLNTVGVPPYFDTKIVHYSPTFSGPFCANLTVKDSNGMVATSAYQLIPQDPQFAPPANFAAQFDPINDSITVSIKDIYGNPVNNAVVNYVFNTNPSGNLTLRNYIGETGIPGTGINSTLVCGNGPGNGAGTVNVVYGSFQPFSVLISNSSTTC